jgi:AcrR family transcriptional regulator
MTKPKTRREAVREATYAEIKEIARQQMAEKGAAALSLNAIAREMRMTTPALYRYFANRDALVTELVVDAYQSLGDALETAVLKHQQDPYHTRFQALCHTYRDWALAYPQDYTLIYGTPIPHYHAPRERTVEPATRVLTTFGLLLGEIDRAGQLTIPAAYQQVSPAQEQMIDALLAESSVEEATAGIFLLTLLVWSRLNGVVWAEMYGHFPPGMADSGELFQLEVTAICNEINLAS